LGNGALRGQKRQGGEETRGVTPWWGETDGKKSLVVMGSYAQERSKSEEGKENNRAIKKVGEEVFYRKMPGGQQWSKGGLTPPPQKSNGTAGNRGGLS